MDLDKSIELFMQQYMELWPFAGSIRVVQQGEVIYNQAFGMACLELEVPNTTDTLFGLASVSKQFTAFAVMQLYDQGLIDIDQPVNTYLPAELQLDPRITAHHLMSHTSGLPVNSGLNDSFYGDRDKINYTKELLLSNFLNRPLSFEPGAKFEYCNAGYHMLAFLVEEITGISFKQYLSENIFTPLGFSHTVLDDGMELIMHKANGYCMNYKSIIKGEYHHLAYSIGAGGMVSSSSDLYKWHAALKSRLLLSAAAYSRFFAENLNGYAYGLFTDQQYGETRYHHDGAYHGIGAYMQNFFEADVCIIVLCNYDFVNYSRIGDAISSLVFTGHALVPQKPPEIALDEQLALKYEGIYIKNRVELTRVNDRWIFIHSNRFHKPLYPIGNHQFHSTWLDHSYTLKECDNGEFEFLGYHKQN
ncbi:class A beta-lactamase-related serine hydrolase [Paenibacillus psychroresistens]|uniref:Class A beta-lactamase-related serine hydrolase n=1 Tax=Paenibacillus psychroresistens TaxID=1778678 RepID=A0A6B8RUZ9_9BACL|nr:serine hydrolase domain-containing protein [Paenibacillus psychroresistens]QGQ99465.1 class A beta-lactamase-related serine hydrolase [Paenibacillus psychroresistens]